MHNELSNKVGIVTGGSSGIGFQIANVLAEAGATVYVISRTGQPKEGYGSSVPGVIHIKGDIGDAGSMTALLEEITAPNDGVLDFLVNNAGVSYKCRAEDFPMDRFDQIMDVNVKYVFQLSVLCYPHLKKSAGRGRIVNILLFIILFAGISALAEINEMPAAVTSVVQLVFGVVWVVILLCFPVSIAVSMRIRAKKEY